MPLYSVVAADTIEQASPDLEAIKASARDLCQKHSDLGGADFVVVEIKEIGRFEKVSPVWIEPSSGAPWKQSSGD